MVDSSSSLRTAAVLPISVWKKARGFLTTGFQETYQLISAMMLTDALRRSGF